jgi:hypothetical protein
MKDQLIILNTRRGSTRFIKPTTKLTEIFAAKPQNEAQF